MEVNTASCMLISLEKSNMENNNLKMGIRDGLPIALGYFAVSFSFGLLSVSEGLLWYQALFISMFNLTSAGQLAAVPIIAGGGSFLELVAAQLVINSRYALMSVSLTQRLGRGTKYIDRLWIGFANTDEIFAVSIGKEQMLGRKYMLGLIILPFFGWTLGTLLGAAAGSILPAVIVTALSVALYAMFIAIVLPAAKHNKKILLCVMFAMASSSLFYYVPVLNKVPAGFVIVICTVIASALFAVLAPIKEESEGCEV